MPFFDFLEDGGAMSQIVRHDPDRLMPFAEMTEKALNGPSPIDSADRELLAAYVSVLNQCQFCAGSHFAVAVERGIDPDLLEGLVTDLQTAAVDDKLKPLFHIANKLTLTPDKMIQADIDRALDAGWDEQAVQDVILITSIFNMANRMVSGHGVTPRNWEENVEDAKGVLKTGYAGRAKK